MGDNSLKSIIKSAFIGIPLPLCSCSVIPFASALKKDGASKSALQTFLISTPITGADSIFATYGAFGWFFTIFRLISSVFIALIAGFLSMFFDKEEVKQKPTMQFFTQVPKNEEMKNCCSSNKNLKTPFITRVYMYAFETLFKDIAKSFFIGLLLAALITTLIPTQMENFLTQSKLLSYLFVLGISVPLYVCATSSIPMGISLILTGFSPGAAFVFLTAGPATNMITISVVKKIMGSKGLLIYLISVILGSLMFGYILDGFFADLLPDLSSMMKHDEAASLLEAVSSVVLLYFGYKAIVPKKESKSCCSM